MAWVCFVAPAKPASGVPAAGVLWHMVGTFIAALTPRPGVRTISPEHDGQAHHHRQNHCTGGDWPSCSRSLPSGIVVAWTTGPRNTAATPPRQTRLVGAGAGLLTGPTMASRQSHPRA